MNIANPSQRIAELEGELAASRRALSRANARLQIFSTQTAFWMWETDAEHRFVHVSDNVQEICGMPVEEVLASNWLETVKGHDAPAWKAHAADLEAHRPFESFRFERHDVGGAVRHHVLSGWPVFDQTGRFRGYRGVGRDETADVAGRERTREVEARYTAEIEAQRDHLLKRTEDFADQTECWFWETDADHVLTYASDNIERLTGTSHSAVIGTNRFDHEPVDTDDPDWQEHLEDLKHHRRFDAFHYVRTNASGEPRHTVVSGWPRFDRSGNFIGYRGTARDETATVRRFEEQARREQEYIAEIERHNGEIEKVLSNLSQGIFWFDAERKVRFQNARAAEVLGLRIGNLADCHTALECMRLLAARGDFGSGDPDTLAASQTDMMFDARTGATRRWWLKSLDRHLRSRYGRLKDGGLIVTFVDVSEEVATEQQLAEARDEIARHTGEIETVLSNLSQGIFWFDAERKVRFHNARAAEIFRVEQAEFASCDNALACMGVLAARGDFGDGDVDALAEKQTEEMFNPASGTQSRWWLKSLDRYLRCRYGRMKDGGLIVTFVDVSVEVHTEQELASARDEIARHSGEIEKVLSNLSQGIFWFDENRKVRFQNTRAAEIFGIPVNELAKCTTALAFMRLLAERGEFGDGDIEALAMSQTDAMFDPMTGAMSRWWLKSCDRHLRCRYGRLDDGGLIVTFVDITEEVITEQQLASARDDARKLAAESAGREYNLETVLDNLSQSIMWMDAERKVKLRNRKMSEMHGFTEADYADVHTFDDHLRLLAARGDMGEGPLDEIIETSIKRIFSSLEGPTDYRRHFPAIDRHFLVRLAPTPDGGRILSEIDITEQVKAEQQLEVALSELEAMNAALEEKVEDRTRELRQTQANLVEAERNATLGKLTAKLSHEMRNPLNALNTSLYIIRAKAGADEKIARALDRSERTVQRCTAILADLYDFAMTIEAKPREVDLGHWLDQALAQVTPPEGVDLRIDNRLEGFHSTIDESQIRKALMKIVDNAVMAVTHEGLERTQRVVSVTAAEAGERLEIIIEDNGCGMDEATASQALEPLFSTRGFGVGLGLPIAEQTFSRHGGGLKFYSRENDGTTVTLWLPADEASGDDTQEAA